MSSLIESKHRGLEWDLMSWCGGWGVTMVDRSDPEAVLITGVYGSGKTSVVEEIADARAPRRSVRRARPGLPESAAEAILQLEDVATPVAAFLRERCRLEAAASVPVEALSAEWKVWCEDQGRGPGTKAIFGRDLKATAPLVRKVRPWKECARSRSQLSRRGQRDDGEEPGCPDPARHFGANAAVVPGARLHPRLSRSHRRQPGGRPTLRRGAILFGA